MYEVGRFKKQGSGEGGGKRGRGEYVLAHNY